MASLYLLVLAGVGLAILATTLEAVWSVSRAPAWNEGFRPLRDLPAATVPLASDAVPELTQVYARLGVEAPADVHPAAEISSAQPVDTGAGHAARRRELEAA